MIAQALRVFIDETLDAGRMTDDDVVRLMQDALPLGVRNRPEADALVALDRMIADRPAAWDDAFVELVTAYALSEAAQGGPVGRDTANWLMTTLDAAGGVTDNGLRIAIEVSRAAAQADQTLMSFVLQAMQARRPAMPHEGRAPGHAREAA